MNSIKLLIVLIFISCSLEAQNNFQQIAIGGGAGLAEAYAGAPVQKMTSAGFADAGYYPDPFFNMNIEWQSGVLSGAAADGKNQKSFNNSYQGVILNAEIQLGEIFSRRPGAFLNAIKHIYVGAGYGMLINSINNADINHPGNINHINNAIPVVPLKLGYECDLIKKYEEPLIKIDFIYSFNYTIGRGLDGYYTANEAAPNIYSYYAIGLKYAITVRRRRARAYNRFD